MRACHVPRDWTLDHSEGRPKKRKAPYASAAREALEEAGVVGEVGRDPIGSYSYKKRLKSGAVVACEVQVFPLEVKHQQKMVRKRGTRVALVLTDCRRESGARAGFEGNHSRLPKDKTNGCAG